MRKRDKKFADGRWEEGREYEMIYEPRLYPSLMIWLLLPSVSSKLDRRHIETRRPATREDRQFSDGKGGGGGERSAKSNDQKKAWSSINHSILSGARGRRGAKSYDGEKSY